MTEKTPNLVDMWRDQLRRNGWKVQDGLDTINASFGRNYRTPHLSMWRTGRRTIPDDVAMTMRRDIIADAIKQAGGRPPPADRLDELMHRLHVDPAPDVNQ